MGWLAFGEVDVPDPDAVVEVAEVKLHDGPMLVNALHQAGIDARGVEAWDFVSKSGTRMRILVRAEDAASAVEIIDTYGARFPHPNP